MMDLIDKLEKEQNLPKEEFKALLLAEVAERGKGGKQGSLSQYLFQRAQKVRQKYYGKEIYIRGLIEITNYCTNDCYYCGIRCGNTQISRYRLRQEQILNCCATGYELGFRTFVLQGGEDGYYTDKLLANLIYEIKSKYADCAVTLSLGEKGYNSYKAFYNAGADRYLLRHETADSNHYSSLHPKALTLENRLKCLEDLKTIGYQVGCGIMIGSPFQTIDTLVSDLIFMKKFQPQMVGIGPFIAHHDTPFKDQANGSVEQTLFMLGLVRLLLPNVLLPSTTALGTLCEDGRERGILAGANVVMPNLSPLDVRQKYMLYDNKISTGDEAAEAVVSLRKRMEAIGYELVVSRGDFNGGDYV